MWKGEPGGSDGLILCGCPGLIHFRSVLAMVYKVPNDVDSFKGPIISDNGLLGLKSSLVLSLYSN
jgi:hypothetical protein